MQPNAFLCFALSHVLVLINLSWSLCIRVTFVPCSNILMLFGIQVSLPVGPTGLGGLREEALRVVLGTDYVSYANALDVCDVGRLSARGERHSLKFAQSLPKCGRTGGLLPPCGGGMRGRQLRNNARLTQPRARTDGYACGPVTYCVELVGSGLPWLNFLLSVFLFARLLHSLALFLCCLLLYFWLCFWSHCVFFLFLFLFLFFCLFVCFPSCLKLYIVIRPLGRGFVQIKSNKIISYHIISYHIISYHIISYHTIFLTI